jgi:TRAP-type uncharacterized transport system substrate-binding protein
MMLVGRLVAAVVVALCATGHAQAQKIPPGKPQAAGARAPASAKPLSTLQRQQINEWTVGLAGGQLEGAPIRLAAEISRVVNDGNDLHVLPIVTRGPTENLNDLLYLKGVDLAIISSDSLDLYKAQMPDIQNRITYILSLFPSELHVFVRPEIASLRDLAGKKVNFNTQGTAAAYTGPLLFSRLGIEVNKTFIPHPLALEQMKKPDGDMAAVVFITSKPVDLFLKGKWESGFKFLPVPYDERLEDYYLPAMLEAADYPSLIAPGRPVNTVAALTILVAYKWEPDSDRYRRVSRFVENLFSRFDGLQAAGFDPKWRDVNLYARVPGLARFPAAQQWLDSHGPQTGAGARR